MANMQRHAVTKLNKTTLRTIYYLNEQYYTGFCPTSDVRSVTIDKKKPNISYRSYIWCEAEFTKQKKHDKLKGLMVALWLTGAQKILVKATSFMNET